MNASARSISAAMVSNRAPAGDVRTKSLFQSCTIVRSAMPVAVRARTRFMAADALA